MALTAEDIKKASDQAAQYSGELQELAKANGVDIKDVKGNDAGELLKASGAGLATGAAVGAAVGAAFPPLILFTTAAGAIIGAIAAFAAKFRIGPSAEQIKLEKEFSQLNATIHQLVLTVPQPNRAELMALILAGMREHPGPLPFCLGGGEAGIEGGGCVHTSMEGVRAAAFKLDEEVKRWAVKAQADLDGAAQKSRNRTIGGALLLAGLLGLGAYKLSTRRNGR